MNASKQNGPKLCAGCGAAIHGKNMAMGIKLPGPEGTFYPACSDRCMKRIWDSLAGRFETQGRCGIPTEDALMKSFGLATARELQIAKETDRFLRQLGL